MLLLKRPCLLLYTMKFLYSSLVATTGSLKPLLMPQSDPLRYSYRQNGSEGRGMEL